MNEEHVAKFRKLIKEGNSLETARSIIKAEEAVPKPDFKYINQQPKPEENDRGFVHNVVGGIKKVADGVDHIIPARKALNSVSSAVIGGAKTLTNDKSFSQNYNETGNRVQDLMGSKNDLLINSTGEAAGTIGQLALNAVPLGSVAKGFNNASKYNVPSKIAGKVKNEIVERAKGNASLEKWAPAKTALKSAGLFGAENTAYNLTNNEDVLNNSGYALGSGLITPAALNLIGRGINKTKLKTSGKDDFTNNQEYKNYIKTNSTHLANELGIRISTDKSNQFFQKYGVYAEELVTLLGVTSTKNQLRHKSQSYSEASYGFEQEFLKGIHSFEKGRDVFRESLEGAVKQRGITKTNINKFEKDVLDNAISNLGFFKAQSNVSELVGKNEIVDTALSKAYNIKNGGVIDLDFFDTMKKAYKKLPMTYGSPEGVWFDNLLKAENDFITQALTNNKAADKWRSLNRTYAGIIDLEKTFANRALLAKSPELLDKNLIGISMYNPTAAAARGLAEVTNDAVKGRLGINYIKRRFNKIGINNEMLNKDLLGKDDIKIKTSKKKLKEFSSDNLKTSKSLKNLPELEN